jgi:hypothetical protein
MNNDVIIIINCIVIVILLVFAYKIFQTDVKDRMKPFGTDTYKNEKFAKGKLGEDFGVNTYWGRPSKTDTNQNILDKIQWLSQTPENDVIWRRSFVFGLIFSLLSVIALGIFDYKNVIIMLFIMFVSNYTSVIYYKRHLLNRRIKFIDIHVQKLKEDLKIPLYNKITNSMII